MIRLIVLQQLETYKIEDKNFVSNLLEANEGMMIKDRTIKKR